MEPNFKLENLRRENVYNVPEAYFDKLPNRIMQRVTKTPEVSESKFRIPAYLRMALAGSGFAAVFATVFLLNTEKEKPVSYSLTSVPKTEIVNYLLASEQMDHSDLTILNVADRDLTADFVSANQTDIHQELEDQQLEDLY